MAISVVAASKCVYLLHSYDIMQVNLMGFPQASISLRVVLVMMVRIEPECLHNTFL